MIALLFPIAVTIHNIEEAIWLPAWSKSAAKFHQPMDKAVFRFAVIVITVMAYLVTALYILIPENPIVQCCFVGFVGSMIINAFFPHLAATVYLKKYCPGTVTGLLLILPSNLFILSRVINDGTTGIIQILLSTLIMGGLLLVSLPLLFKAGAIVNSRG